ncbi:hypothetical protein UFOVP1131_59 [uncultured Caudovirales phage]|uniref:Uncharacterized protein n=1 Tax=uncultured Caudovirales phage TaxID=2100421 RepID=A0A6J5R5W9_9CAUD|nr:hypothetical protein UFOVP966_73 [uncultured Caudovirales phage]CAB4184945.1 hypothetical protein UFOVP1131_59 [uncultured Caudovirales phage]CAB4192193.1 hypothetical protein UFOVP1245_3 [uncultured Caudovirales phage]CAB5231261.1 hypothetical protein UFOVP1582_51 [uncultured Caudovirales phage]
MPTSNVTGSISVLLQPKLLNHTPLGDGFFNITNRVMFSESGNDSTFEFVQSSDGNQSTAKFSLFTMFPISVTRWSGYSGATVDDKVANALVDPTFDFEIPSRTEVKIYEGEDLVFGGIVTEVSRIRQGGMIIMEVKCADYTALLDELVIDRYKVPYLAKDYEIIKGGFSTDADENAIKITKLNDGGSGSVREIVVSLDDAHDLTVGQEVVIDKTTNYNGTWTVSEILSLFAYKATKSGTSPYSASSETSGRHIPRTISFFDDIRTTDPYSGATFNAGITFDSSSVKEELSQVRFSPVTYLPDPKFPEQLGAKIWIPFGDPKSSSGRLTFDPKSGDTTTDLRLARIESTIVERYAIKSISTTAQGTSPDLYYTVTIMGTHYITDGTRVGIQNALFGDPNNVTQMFRVDNVASDTTLRIYTEQGVNITPITATITAATSANGKTTYTAVNTFKVGDFVGISDITQSGSTGTFNIPMGTITSCTPTSFTINNTTTNTYTSGGFASVTFVTISDPASLQAAEKRFRIVAGCRPNITATNDIPSDSSGTGEIWFDGKLGISGTPTGKWFNKNEIAFISKSNQFDGRIRVEANDDDSESGLEENYYVARWKRRKNIVTLQVARKAADGKIKFTRRHPFEKGSIITITGTTGPAGGSTNAPNANDVTITNIVDGMIQYEDAGKPHPKLLNLTQAQRAVTSVTISSAVLTKPYVMYADSREGTGNTYGQTPERIGYNAVLSHFQWEWQAVASGDRGAGTPSSSFTTMPYDALEYIGGRQGVKFVGSKYNAVSSAMRSEIYSVKRSGTLVTVQTYAPVWFPEGGVVRVDSGVSSVNGTFSVVDVSTEDTTPGFTYKTETSGTVSETVTTGYAYNEHNGFWAMGKSFSAICVVRVNDSLPSSGQFHTIWHHGSITTGQRRELKVDSTGQIIFSPTSSINMSTGLTLLADEDAMIYVSLDHTNGNLRVRKNDETPYATTLGSNYSGTTDPRSNGDVASNLTIGHGYSSSSVPNNFLNATLGDFIVSSKCLNSDEELQFISWFAHWYTLQDKLQDDNDYRDIINLPGKTRTNRAKEPFNGMTLRQAMDYICKKTGCQYWVDQTKTLHYVRRDIKNLVKNPTFEDTYGGFSTANWTTGSGFSITSRTGGPYGYGYAMQCSGTTAVHSYSNLFAVSPGNALWASAMIKSSDVSKSRLKIRFFNASGVQVGADKTIGSGLDEDNTWQKMWGIVDVPSSGSITQAAVVFDHNSKVVTYTDYYADPICVILDGEFGFADYGRAPGSSYELLFDPQFNDPSTGIYALKTFETPQNISQHGSQSNRLYVYAKATSVDRTGDVIMDNVVAGQVIRYTFDFVQGVWASHGKLIEASTTNSDVETLADATKAASTFWAENGQAIQSYEFDHSTNASSGRLSVGSVVPYLWTEVGITEPLVVKSQTTRLIGGEFYYSVQLAGEPAFQQNAIILVKKDKLTVSLGSGQLAYTRPTSISSVLATAQDEDGLISANDLRVLLQWSFDDNDPRNTLVKGFEVQRRAQKLAKKAIGPGGLTNRSLIGDVAIRRTAALAGKYSTVKLALSNASAIRVGDLITIDNWKNAKKFTKGNPSINGTWSVTSVQNSGRVVCFKMLAHADTAIAVSAQTKAQVAAQCPSLVIKWREHGAAEAATEWLGFNSLVTTKSFSDDGEFVGAGKSSINYRYQYRIRAVAITSDDAKLYGDWTYVPETSVSSLVDSSWIYVTRDLRVAAAAPVEEDLT